MISIEQKRKVWLKARDDSKSFMEQTILPSIEKNRKGDKRLRLLDAAGKPLAGQRVTIEQDGHDFNFGAQIFMLDGFSNEVDNQKYRALFKEHFNLATLPFYFDGLEPNRGKPRFSIDSEPIYRRPAPDLCLQYCEENGVRAKLHCLVYDKFIPQWLTELSLKEAEAAYEERIRKIAERYRGRLVEFEVINETLESETWHIQSAVTKKRDVVEWAFALAKKYLPDETLVMNEGNRIARSLSYGFRDPYFLQLEKCLAKGTPIDKVGIQHHTFTGTLARTPEEFDEAVAAGSINMDPVKVWQGLDLYADLGLPLEVTEMTIPTLGQTEEDEQIQAELLEMLYTVMFAHPALDTIVYWNTVDGYCFVDEKAPFYWNENNTRGGIFHRDLTPKRSALALHKLLHETWHTKLDAVTDADGCIDFRGFYGTYRLTTPNGTYTFGNHKNEPDAIDLVIG